MTRWLEPLGDRQGLRLVVFPHAGAGCAQFVSLARLAAAHRVQMTAASLPGRQARLAEAAYTEFDPLVAELASAVAGQTDGEPYALFGYCGGALLAYGVARRLWRHAAPLPSHLVVASYEAPDIVRLPLRVPALPPDRLWGHLVESGGIPPNLDHAAREVTEGAIAADFAVLAGYRHLTEPPLPVPITVLYGKRDLTIQRGALLGWRRQTAHPLRMTGLDAGHWLLDDAPDELVATLAETLTGGDR